MKIKVLRLNINVLLWTIVGEIVVEFPNEVQRELREGGAQVVHHLKRNGRNS